MWWCYELCTVPWLCLKFLNVGNIIKHYGSHMFQLISVPFRISLSSAANMIGEHYRAYWGILTKTDPSAPPSVYSLLSHWDGNFLCKCYFRGLLHFHSSTFKRADCQNYAMSAPTVPQEKGWKYHQEFTACEWACVHWNAYIKAMQRLLMERKKIKPWLFAVLKNFWYFLL